MAEPKHAGPVPVDSHDSPAHAPRADILFTAPLVVIQTATAAGYGLWMVLGTSLALGLYPDGRGEVLVPLSVGVVLVSLGLVATCLRLPFAADWHGWNPSKRMMPTVEGLVAMANYLPMLALAGLARGGNDFWATRLAGVALAVCTFATLVYTARSAARGLTANMAAVANAQPLGRIVSAVFAGGLWFWFCVALQSETSLESLTPWRLGLLAVALALGIVEGMRWRALRQLAEERGLPERFTTGGGAARLLVGRVGVAVLSVGLPCLLMVSHPAGHLLAPAAGLAALSCVIGQCLEQRLYGRAQAQLVTI
jgi:hypothetical protein